MIVLLVIPVLVILVWHAQCLSFSFLDKPRRNSLQKKIRSWSRTLNAFSFLRGWRVSFVYCSSFRFSVKKCSKSKGNKIKLNKIKQIILNFLQLTLNTNEMLTNLLSLPLTRFSRPLSFSNLNFLKSKLILDIWHCMFLSLFSH